MIHKEKNKKKMVYTEFEVDVSYKTLGECMALFKELIEEHGEEASFNVDTEVQYGDTCVNTYISTRREETDEEYKNRLKREQDEDERHLAILQRSIEKLEKKLQGG